MPRPCASCAPLVFRCFKKVERFADWLTGAAGPVFIALAWVLMGSGAIIFFELVYPALRPHLPALVYYPLAIPLLAVAVNLFGHYHLVCTIRPGSPSDGEGKGRRRAGEWWWAQPRRPASSAAGGGGSGGRRWEGQAEQEEGLADDGARVGRGVGAGRPKVKKCRKCGGAKPERAHHCSVCKSCVLKFDHHCPWINGCVGLRNERHFILFMTYLVLACTLFCSLSWQHFIPSLNLSDDWPYYTPRLAFTLVFVLALALGIAVAVMCSWHVLQICWGETSVEGHDNAFYSTRAKNEGRPWENRWDLGWRRNLEVFFNVGPDGYPYTTLLLPFRILPHSDGTTWERRAGYVETGEEDDLTDDDEGGGGYL